MGNKNCQNSGYLVKLKTISFWGCNVETVEAGAFKGVPQLKNVQISFSNLKKIRMGVFNPIETLELLRIHDNRIETIDDQAFANLTSLKKIYAGNNALSYWHSNWFRNSTNLQTMDFHNNKIRTLPRRAFATLPKLKRINLDWNEISAIESEAFRGLKKLQYLGLGNNRLTVIHESVFPSSIQISTLLINANYLNYLSGELLNKVSVLEVFLDYNPWKCPCLKEIYAWIHSTKGALRVYDGCGSNHVPVCANKKSVLQCSENVDEELSRRYLGVFANLTKPLASGCVRTN
ncbi:unnamed protein product [Phaedon cochleariae]|uniref:Uncharacterized protein n=1 Tax=Phaedon cochleariae TaxID=80249 RepID=A0A9N9SJ61_PHACE|nr:unnamed protein product [Phaedon cochleariae]